MPRERKSLVSLSYLLGGLTIVPCREVLHASLRGTRSSSALSITTTLNRLNSQQCKARRKHGNADSLLSDDQHLGDIFGIYSLIIPLVRYWKTNLASGRTCGSLGTRPQELKSMGLGTIEEALFRTTVQCRNSRYVRLRSFLSS